MPYGVGIIGAGPGVAALHRPPSRGWAGTSESCTSSDCRQRTRRGDRAAHRCPLVDRHRRSARRSRGRGRRRLQPAGRARRADPRRGRRGQARDLLREADRDDRGRRRGGDRRVPRGAHARCSSARTTSSTPRGGGRRHHLAADGRPGPRGRGHRGAAAERAVSRRRHRTRLRRRLAPRCGPDLREPAGRRGRRPSAAHRARRFTTCRSCAISPRTSSASSTRGPSRRSATPSAYDRSGVPIRLAAVMLPDGRGRAVAHRHHDRLGAGRGARFRRPSCTTAVRRCRCASPTAG